MSTSYNAQSNNKDGRYAIQFETSNHEYFKMVERACQRAVDKNIGALTFFSHDLGETISIHDYLIRLLSTLWHEQDEFSGKRPFGNSGWSYDLMACLIANNIIPGELDEEGYVNDVDYEKGDEVIRGYIKLM